MTQVDSQCSPYISLRLDSSGWDGGQICFLLCCVALFFFSHAFVARPRSSLWVSRLAVEVIWYVNGWTVSRDAAFEAARRKNRNRSRVQSNQRLQSREAEPTKLIFKVKINFLHFPTVANLFFSVAFPRLYFEDCDVNIVFVGTARSENTDGTWNVFPERVQEGWRLSAGCIITIIQLRWLSGGGYRCWGQRRRD